MFAYVTVGVSDFDRSVKFYNAIFKELGYGRETKMSPGWFSWGAREEEFNFCICRPHNGEAPTAGNGTMFAFRTATRKQADECYAAALSHGGTDEGAPGYRENYPEWFYVGYFRDPDGNKFAITFDGPSNENENGRY